MKTKVHPLFAILALVGMGLVLLTRIVRPNLVDPLPVFEFIFGVLPNFGAGLGMPSVLSILTLWNQQRIAPAASLQRIVLVCSLISLVGLTAWEFTGGTIDKFDLLASLIGILIALVLLLLIKQNPIAGEPHDQTRS
jgi:hypothetical protein